jgi:hypothetical protein
MEITRRMRGQKNAHILLEEISMLNRVSAFRDINLKHRRRASVPEVGVFWIDVATAKVYADKTRLPDADDNGVAKMHPLGHYDVWKKIQAQNPKWRGMEYEDIPRGRVVYLKDPHHPKFVVFTNESVKTAKLKNAIAAEFNLPTGYYEFRFDDDHYQIVSFSFCH